MLFVGLTGGLACGKSTVAAVFREKGAGLVNADVLGHEAIRRGRPAYEALLAEFGRDIVDAEGEIDRARLAALVFGDTKRVRRLNGIVHPAIRTMIGEHRDAFAAEHPDGILVLEAALLLEAFAEASVDKVVVVDCSEEQQVDRFVRKGGTAENARRRMQAQLTRAERLRRADYVIDGSGSIDDTRRQAARVYEELRLFERSQ